MSDTFTASNGKRVATESEEGGFTVGYMPLTGKEVAALREFFQHERDKELGRWRDPESRDHVVYPARMLGEPGKPSARVLDEATGLQTLHGRNDTKLPGPAANYFAAHPEPKPWHDAKPGEVWVLSLEGEPETAQVVDGYGKFAPWTVAVESDGNTRGKITGGRRIWPEVKP